MPDDKPINATIRQIIDDEFRTSVDLDAFVLDHFPKVHWRFSYGMDRIEKVNLLLQIIAIKDVFAALIVNNQKIMLDKEDANSSAQVLSANASLSINSILQRESLSVNPKENPFVDFAILTAIEVERQAVCAAFGLTDEHRVRKGSRVYWRGRLALGNDNFYELVVAQSPDMANIDAALLTVDTLHHWNPGAALLIGIAASAHSDIQLGDIVLGSDVYYYERGKQIPEELKPEPKMVPADATLWSNIMAVPERMSAA